MLLSSSLLAGAWKAIKSFLSSITLRQYLYFFGALLIAYGLWSAYSWAYNRGSHSRDAEVAQLQQNLKNVTDERNALRDAFQQWKLDTKAAETRWQAEQEQIQNDLRQQLAAANAKAAKRRIEYREIVKYISTADDAACTLPVNALLLHNWSIEGEPPGALNQLSQTATGVQSAPSSLRLSEYIAVTQHNNSEAVRRGEIISQWEAWYESSYKAFTKALQDANRTVDDLNRMVPSAPAATPPTSGNIPNKGNQNGAIHSENSGTLGNAASTQTTQTQPTTDRSNTGQPVTSRSTDSRPRSPGVPLPDYSSAGD